MSDLRDTLAPHRDSKVNSVFGEGFDHNLEPDAGIRLPVLAVIQFGLLT